VISREQYFRSMRKPGPIKNRDQNPNDDAAPAAAEIADTIIASNRLAIFRAPSPFQPAKVIFRPSE